MRKLKKLAIVCSMALLALFCMFGATACDNILAGGDRDQTKPCAEHKMVREVVVEPTCTDEGTALLKCETCGYSEESAIDALGHAYHNVVAKDATCTEDGWNSYQLCVRANCGYENNKRIYPALGHDDTHEDSKPATCQSGAFCGVCKSVYTDPLNHEIVVVQEAAKLVTCTEEGWDTYIHCGYVDPVTNEKCPYTTQIIEAALGHDGERDVDGDNVVDAFVNRFSSAATCTKKAFCGVCNNEYGADPTHETPSTYNDSTAATCDKAAYCAKCGESYGAPLGHMIEKFGAKLPSCTGEGWYAYEACTRPGCNYTTQVKVAALGHHEVPIAGVEPTCTMPGHTAGTQCDRCLEFLQTVQPLAALGHDGQRVNQGYANFVSNASYYADCTTKGYCGICNEFYGETPVGSHYVEIIPEKLPTCTETGWYAYEKCLNCAYSTYAENERLELGHQYVYVERVEPTCTEYGHDECTYCVYCETLQLIAPKGHDVDCTRNENSKPINCEDRAFCGDCGEYYGDYPYGRHESLNEATCISPQICDKCGVEYGERKHLIRPDGSCYHCGKFLDEIEAVVAKEDED